jgi:two-component system nitrate/nitrite response regulator NarL
MLTMSREEKDLECALHAGAQGYLLKDMDPEELVPSLNDALKGNEVYSKGIFGPLTRIVQGQTASPAESEKKPDAFSDLTPRETEILGHIAKCKENKVIARELNIADGTVKLHVRSILRKLGMRSRTEVAVWAVKHGM